MKKIIFTIAFIISLSATSHAEETNTDAAALNIFKAMINQSGEAVWTNKNDYYKTSLVFNDHEISAWYIAPLSLVGLSCKLAVNDLPQPVLNRIKKRYSGFNIENVLAFMDSNGIVKYYAIIKTGKKYTALKISAKGRLCVLKKFSIRKNSS